MAKAIMFTCCSEYPPKAAVANMVGRLEVSSRLLRKERPDIVQRYYKDMLWPPCYCAARPARLADGIEPTTSRAIPPRPNLAPLAPDRKRPTVLDRASRALGDCIKNALLGSAFFVGSRVHRSGLFSQLESRPFILRQARNERFKL